MGWTANMYICLWLELAWVGFANNRGLYYIQFCCPIQQWNVTLTLQILVLMLNIPEYPQNKLTAFNWGNLPITIDFTTPSQGGETRCGLRWSLSFTVPKMWWSWTVVPFLHCISKALNQNSILIFFNEILNSESI